MSLREIQFLKGGDAVIVGACLVLSFLTSVSTLKENSAI
jgi:hypothetical protein